MDTPDIRVRLATAADAEGILDVCSAALGWKDAEFDRALFSWKHFSNAFGPSIIFVAEGDDGLLAVRPFMQWAFTSTSGTVRAARAVDTATHPDAQGRGLFRTLTQAGLAELEAQNIGFVFNTPNDKSRPGYLSMGWREVGSINFGFGLRSPARLVNIVRSRTGADKPSIETPDLGLGVAEGLESVDPARLSITPDQQLRTAHDRESLLWRFAGGPITYRWLPVDGDGGCIVRLRSRGASRELVVAHVLTGSADSAWSTVRAAMRQVNADYCLAPPGFGRTRTIGRIGPTLTLRDVTQHVDPTSLSWAPGDIEIF